MYENVNFLRPYIADYLIKTILIREIYRKERRSELSFYRIMKSRSIDEKRTPFYLADKLIFTPSHTIIIARWFVWRLAILYFFLNILPACHYLQEWDLNPTLGGEVDTSV